ncbi:hypothetical protein Taro_041608 [Colocasia esculenta]|uniref:Myb-like domain-containing protein n=1 Tax=Colocasia esculenta TaxID=4460 RepID=A0A843X0V6_COLES|nr:hypothetical protein [Colocasia esculenta]
MANAVAGDGHAGGGGSAGRGARPQRLPRWTPRELRVLVQGKKVAETRARSRVISAGEPKWTAVSDYCRRHGVERSPRQCRKRWDNLARDYRRIKVWECRRRPGGGEESFWAMRNERRRERGLPGFFDRVVYEMLEGAREAEVDDEGEDEEPGSMRGVPPLLLAAAAEEEGPLFDSGRAAAEDELFSDFEEDEEEDEAEEEGEGAAPLPPTLATPISGRSSFSMAWVTSAL